MESLAYNGLHTWSRLVTESPSYLGPGLYLHQIENWVKTKTGPKSGA